MYYCVDTQFELVAVSQPAYAEPARGSRGMYATAATARLTKEWVETQSEEEVESANRVRHEPVPQTVAVYILLYNTEYIQCISIDIHCIFLRPGYSHTDTCICMIQVVFSIL